jgi:hypothetical protein
VLLAVVGALAFASLAWPRGDIGPDAAALASIDEPGFGVSGVTVTAREVGGPAIPVVLRPDGRLWPARRVAPGTRIEVDVVFHRPGWVGWIAGREQRQQYEFVAPTASVAEPWLRLDPKAPVRVRFDRPVRVVQVTGDGPRRLRPAVWSLVLPRSSAAGSVGVRAAARSWETLTPATTVTWFPRSTAAGVLVTPKPGSTLGLGSHLRLRFSEPVKTLFGPGLPKAGAAGSWQRPDSHTLEFVPRGYGFGLDAPVRVVLPRAVAQVGGRAAKTISWKSAAGTQLRLQQLLAELGYLPVSWTSAHSDAARSVSSQLAAASDPPAGSFSWRYGNIPPELSALWHPGQANDIVRGAVMMFQDTHHLTVDGYAGADVWRALIADVIAGRGRTDGYSYVYVHRSVPQSLNLWHNGSLVLSSPGNTGVPQAPTQLGTFPVFEHIPVGTMSGTNPDGSHYNDPGIQWISYFNGGDAIHSFNRASFGTPQSLGCVELPLAAAAQVWPYTPIGTLVTIEN